MKRILNSISILTLAMFAATDAFAANQNLNTIIDDPKFKGAVTLGFAIFAFFKWVEYFADFSPGSALKSIVLPAILTFLTFKWSDVLGWVGLK